MSIRIVRMLSVLTVIACLSALSECATMVNGTTEKIQLSSAPDGAQATIDGTQTVTTPTTVELSRDNEHTITFHKDGYQDDTEKLTSSTSGWIWGNILVGGVVGAVVDAESGAGKKLSSDAVSVSLVPLPAKNAVGAASISTASQTSGAVTDLPAKAPAATTSTSATKLAPRMAANVRGAEASAAVDWQPVSSHSAQ
jgi:hypothetical protein